jgi:hypothetical protein
MTFKELLKRAKTGDVISYRGSGVAAWLVRWWTRTDVAHVGFAIWLRFGTETEDRLCLLHSHPLGGINIVPVSETLGGRVYHQATKERGEEAVGYALSQWGKRYASPWQFALMLSPWLREKWQVLGFDLRSDGKLHCSQLVAEALEFAMPGHIQPKPSAEMTPIDIVRLTVLGPREQVV